MFYFLENEGRMMTSGCPSSSEDVSRQQLAVPELRPRVIVTKAIDLAAAPC